jgi:hypothetical protein
MEIEEEQNINYLNDNEKNIRRFIMNTELDIFQNNNDYCIRPSNIPFNNSYEHQLIQNNSSSILSSSSNLVYYTLGKDLNNIYQAKKKLRKLFYDNEQNKIFGKSQLEIKNEDKKIAYKIIKNKVGNDNRIIELDMLINRSDFDQQMKNNRNFVERVFNNPYFSYHPKAEEISNYYSNFNI